MSTETDVLCTTNTAVPDNEHEQCSQVKGMKRKAETDICEPEILDLVKQAKPASEATADGNVLKSLDEWDDWKADYVKAQDHKEEKPVVVADKPKENFRNYVNSARQERVAKFYALQHEHQTLEFGRSMVEKYGKLDHFEMTIWEAIEYLNGVVDDSDPDTDLTQLQHALQTAEACRKKWPEEKYDWIHLTGLIHDLGKIQAVKNEALNLPGEPQWAVVGDTFPLGAPFSDKNILHESFKNNPDYKNETYQTGCGVYQKGCGLSNVTMSWGHDEYIYRVIAGNSQCTLPLPALYMLRYHSFYPWHRENAYIELTDEQDRDMLQYVKEFNECDLYSKSETPPNVEELAPYYKKLIDKYLPGKLRW